jgi:predicted transcriptional regulator
MRASNGSGTNGRGLPPSAGTVAARRNSGELESQVLDLLWAAATPLTPAQTHSALGGGLAYNTVHTVLTRLCEKGLIRRATHEGRPAYTPVQDAAEWAAGQMRAVLDRGSDRGAILHRFISNLHPDEEQVLRAALDQPQADRSPGTTRRR